MLVLLLEDHANSAAANLKRKLVRRLAHGGSALSGVRASGKPGAVHLFLSADVTDIAVRFLAVLDEDYPVEALTVINTASFSQDGTVNRFLR
jgi:hypothetical protein